MAANKAQPTLFFYCSKKGRKKERKNRAEATAPFPKERKPIIQDCLICQLTHVRGG